VRLAAPSLYQSVRFARSWKIMPFNPQDVSLTSQAAGRPSRIVSIGSAVPPQAYSQEDVLAWAEEDDPKIRRLFRNSHIQSRSLYLTPHDEGGRRQENNEELAAKHMQGALEIGPQAIHAALEPLGLTPQDVDTLICVTSTGMLTPGVSVRLIEKMGMQASIQRADLVGMGCNAALNALQLTCGMTRVRPKSTAVLLCVEICSAAYALDDSMATAVVNSLFGDGAAAVVLQGDGADGAAGPGPAILDFQSYIHTETMESMKYVVRENTLTFHIDKEIPYIIGAKVDEPVGLLLARWGLEVADVDHWVVHSGGKKVIDAICNNLGLSEHDVRHTRGVLEDQGNVSSASVLFALERLQAEGVAKPGDTGVMIAMGPGMSIETALMRWQETAPSQLK